MKSNEKTRRLVLIAMLSALAYLVMLLIRIPVSVPPMTFFKYEPKDVIIAIGGFLMGPLASLAMAVLVSLVEMFTVSTTGWIGMVMNVISTCGFVLPAAAFYRKDHTLKGAIIGLAIGICVKTGLMVAWNYIMTPIYMGMPREAIAALLVPVFVPFNALVGLLNAGITMLIYKPVSRALRMAHLMPETSGKAIAEKAKINIGVILISVFAIATAITCFYLLGKG